jgi:pSer/pThr/pTyr-binding forkhead associated (FHA) protein
VRFEVKYPSGAPHEVELSGTVAVLGRDPSCDLVLNDARCSRRHAVIEAGPQGVSIRDAGSANGVYVNGKKVERAQLADGDVVRLGEVFIKVLPEEVVGTVVMAPEDMEAVELMHKPIDGERTASVPPTPVGAMPPIPTPEPLPPLVRATSLPRLPTSATVPPAAIAPTPTPLFPTPAPPTPRVPRPPTAAPAPPPALPRAAPPAPRPASGTTSVGRVDRPMTVTLLALLWMFGVLYYPILTVLSLRTLSGLWAYVSGATGILATLVSGVMAWGLWARQGWARIAQIGLCILGILTCAFAPACATILAYLFRGDVAGHFGNSRPAGPGAGEEGRLEPYFTAAVAGLVVLPILALALLGLIGVFAAPAAVPSQ